MCDVGGQRGGLRKGGNALEPSMASGAGQGRGDVAGSSGISLCLLACVAVVHFNWRP